MAYLNSYNLAATGYDMQKRLLTILLLMQLFFYCFPVAAQQCTNRYQSRIYRSLSWDTFTKAIATPAGEFLAIGNIIDDHGMVAKFSPKGTPLFSYQYNPVYQFNTTFFAKLKLTDVIQTKDGSFVAVGNVYVDKWIGQSQYLNWGGVLLKIDPFGNVLWCKRLMTRVSFNNSNFSLAATNVIETKDGDLLVFVAADFGQHYTSYSKVVCYSSQGNQKWITRLATGNFDGGIPALKTKRALLQLRDGSVTVADLIYKTDKDRVKTEAAQVHFFNLEPGSGKIRWESFYHYPLDDVPTYSDITSAAELENGNLTFTLSSYPLSGSSNGIRIETDNKGKVRTATVYTTQDHLENQLVHAGVDKNSGSQSYLLKTPLYSIIANITNTGTIRWQKGYTHADGIFPGSCFTVTDKSYAVFMSSFRNRDMRILFTDANGEIDCANMPTTLFTTAVTLLEESQMKTETDVSEPPGYAEFDFLLQPTANPLPSRIECEAISICCQDVVDSTNLQPVRICEGNSYTLPDGTRVTQSGTYFATYKTAGGCDSIRYYRVKVDKHPAALSLGADLCFEGIDTLQLNATEGFDDYRWMNAAVSQTPFLKITKTGTYWVNVTNSCGSKTDSLTVYDECNFPVFMPSAFSPNGDGRNEVFRFSPQNKNSFVSLKIFSRWGDLIFQTTDGNKGWNGRVGTTEQPAGVYVYYLETIGLSGKKFIHTGTVTLIR